jgi:streptogramin lyase
MERWAAVACLALGLVTFGSAGSALGLQAGSFVHFDVALCQNVVRGLNGVTSGPDGNLWFTDPTGGVGRITPDGSSSTCFPLVSGSNPEGIVSGPDGNLWFLEPNGGTVGKVTPTGTITTYSVPTSSNFISTIVNPSDIASGADGNIWFTELGDNQIGQITPTGTITEFDVPTSGAHPSGIASAADGNLWFTESGANQIGKISPTGTITEFPIPTTNSQPWAIAAGPDGNLWFTEMGADQIGRITPTGTVTEFPVSAEATSITTGSDGNIWFTESDGEVGQATPTGTIEELSVPLGVLGITSGPDKNLWMVDTQADTSVAFPRDAVARMAAQLPPANTGLPSISGTPAAGQILTCADGSWTNAPTVFTYQWNRDAAPIGAAIRQTYIVQTADQGHALTCTVTATNAGGSSPPVGSAGIVVPLPSATSTPTSSGTNPAASAPAPTCTAASSGTVTIPRRKRHHKPSVAGTFPVRVSCNQTSAVTLSSHLTDTPAAKHSGHSPRAKRHQLATIKAVIHARTVLKLTLPASAVTDLEHAAKESVTIALTASNANGTGHTAIHIRLSLAAGSPRGA